ncbi:hypothetical protein MRX96_012344 [Rhipicephalus microplus]
MQGFGSTSVSTGPKTDSSGNAGITMDLLSMLGPLSVAQAHTQSNSVRKKVAQGILLGHRHPLLQCAFVHLDRAGRSMWLEHQ